jgi:ribosomal protein S18 acetylase RimI-like enzyme
MPVMIYSARNMELVRELFREYQQELAVDLCFQDFEGELASLPGPYASPKGAVFLASSDGDVAGCVAFKPLGGEACELKRLYVRPAFRGRGIARALCEHAIFEAKRKAYRVMRLDTLERLESAVRLYKDLEFVEIDPYYDNPLPEPVLFMERAL